MQRLDVTHEDLKVSIHSSQETQECFSLRQDIQPSVYIINQQPQQRPSYVVCYTGKSENSESLCQVGLMDRYKRLVQVPGRK